MSSHKLGINKAKLNKKQLAAGVMLSALSVTGVQSLGADLGLGNVQHVASAAEVASAVTLTDMANPALENAKVVQFDSLGADPTGVQDSSAAWEKAIQMSAVEAIRLEFTPGARYKLDITHDIQVVGSKGIFLDGKGATLDVLNAKPNPTDPASATLYETYVGQFEMAKGSNAGFKMDNLNIDGSRNPNNLFFTFQDGKWSGYDTSGIAISGLRKTRLMRGFHVENAEKLDVSDSKFSNLFAGYTLLLENYRKVNINNLTLDKVGGDGQTDSLGMGLYFAGHTFDDTVININNFKMNGNLGIGTQSNPWTGVTNPGDPSYTSWIGIVIENGSIQSNNPDAWLVDKNTTLNVTNSQIDNVEHTFHVESMAGNVAVNMNNVSSHAKAFGISAGIKGKYQFTGNKLDLELLPYGRNGLYSSVFSSEFGDDTRYHVGYNANLTDANGGSPMHTSLVANSKITFVPGDVSKVDKNFGESYATVDYGNMVNGNFECTQFDNLPNKLFANGGGYMTDVVINLADINPNEATFAGIKGDPGLAGQYIKTDNVVVNDSGAWTNLQTTCQTPQFTNFSGLEAPVLDNAVTPAPIGGGGTTTPTTEAPTTEKPTTEAPTTEIVTTEAPTTEAVTTEKATTESPTTEVVTTETPTTEAVTTENPDGTYSVKGKVFQDKNYDGLYDAETEGKIKNFKVVIKDSLGNVVKETETGSDGTYSVDGLKPGTYSLSFLAPTLEYAPTISNIDLDKSDDKDSDGPTDVRLVIENSSVLNVDQGFTSIPANANLTDPTEPVTTEAPTTEAPTTEAPTTEAPTTEEVTTEAPTTEVVTTEVVTTELPTTEAPTTEVPTTEEVTTEAPTTEVVTTEAPTTEVVTTEAPTTEAVTTENPDGTYSVTGKVFQDKNYNGLYDAEIEGKVKNFKVVIKDDLGNVVKETETGSDGTYSVDGLKPGTYSLSFLAPTLEYSPSIANIDLDKSDDRDSDGPTDVRLVIENSSISNVDQGYLNIPANADVTDPTEPVTTEAPTTEVPTTEAPTTEEPTTEEVTTELPTTEEPTTEEVTTELPTTEAPTTEAPNTKPELDVDSVDTELVEGGEFDALEGVSATDKEDGELTSKIKVDGEVDTTKPGEYEITYSVMDSDGEEVVKTVTVKVLAKETEEPTTEAPTTEASTTEEVTTEKVTTEKVTTEINNNNNNNNNIGDNFPDDVKNPGDLPDTGNEQNKGLLAGGLGMLLAGLTVLGSKFRKFN